MGGNPSIRDQGPMEANRARSAASSRDWDSFQAFQYPEWIANLIFNVPFP